MLKGFKDFIMRGNVVDLAVGVVIGAAFTAVVTGFTNAFLKPLIQLLGGGTGVGAGSWDVDGVKFDYATFINAVITFLLTAAVIYFLVVYPLNRLAERRKRGEEPPPSAPSEEVKLLTEIRDALVGAQLSGDRRSALDDVLNRERREQ
ncbi:large conductance mechanosensitive channel protein MscL [Spirilliplanes yamanashiensis]|uniref:Large-conductance mechanosensitive channel n=1 Tax=Spirilliplanes yamanashiensis TaxID=42233 RepID=A0A8J4DMQ3_9ACTN|nr:large conductance mechanosensitive channel protein MscL [Spirilliplanes yamanashiensis]MDP9815281.1 large conductance mechanosensitive channel [Spirilliplanes yamanashiensis]GIJ06449.1 large-conductance mechanosensitive channel [Spirilliplanes yamanashiensis]